MVKWQGEKKKNYSSLFLERNYRPSQNLVISKKVRMVYIMPFKACCAGPTSGEMMQVRRGADIESAILRPIYIFNPAKRSTAS